MDSDSGRCRFCSYHLPKEDVLLPASFEELLDEPFNSLESIASASYLRRLSRARERLNSLEADLDRLIEA